MGAAAQGGGVGGALLGLIAIIVLGSRSGAF